VSGLVAFLGFAVFAARRLLTYLHLFQQEEYDNPRFFAWLATNLAVDRRLSLALLAIGIAQLLVPDGRMPAWSFGALTGIACLAVAAFERDPRKNAKKRLAMTARATRIYAIAAVLLAVAALLVAAGASQALLWIVPVQLLPFALVAANLLLAPFEARTQRRYWHEAHEKLRRLDPLVIAVTGSYGKTSVKHILGHIIETAAPTLITPGSVNTAMGIARVIRERLQPHHRYLVVEMGAYGPGSIRRLCDLTPPRWASSPRSAWRITSASNRWREWPRPSSSSPTRLPNKAAR
jgi:UDP-N-acetylmuramoyl-tripeptide--D-alanyl-D-alanine ligase